MANHERIRALNDAFRRTFVGGKIMMTQGVDALSVEAKGDLIRQLRTFDKFDLANDPYAEHDFGSIEADGDKFFWKIDYYDPSMDAGSDDPSNPAQTTRVLTIMRADEY